MKKIKLIALLFPLLLFSEEPIFKNDYIGIELSPIRLIAQESDYHSFSGGISYFLKEQNAELHFPIYIKQNKWDEYNEQTVTVDAEYRKFINKKLYVGGLFRVAKLWGGEEDKSTTKLGLGTSIGFRFFYSNNLYFGIGASYTYFFSGENHIFGSGGGISMPNIYNDDPKIFEFEFLKLGYAF